MLGAYRDTALDTVDAAGNAFLDGYAQRTDAKPSLFRYDPRTGTTTTLLAGVPMDASTHTAVSDTGDAFATVPDPSGSGATDVYRQPVAGASIEVGEIAAADGTVVGLAADPRGNLFATTTSGNIVKVTAGGTVSQVGSLAGSAGTTARGFIDAPVADAAGDLFSLTTDGATDALIELAAGSKAVTVLRSTPTPDPAGDQSLATNAAGDVYCAVSNDFTVTVLKVRGAGSPVLSVTTGQTTVPATIVAGTKVKGAVAVRLANTGRTALRGTETVQLYADTAGQAAADGTVVGTARHGTVAGDSSAAVSVKANWVALPSGRYTLAAVVTDATGVVVATVLGLAVNVVPATVTLSATVTNVSAGAVAPGKSSSFTLTVTNDGTVATTGTASVAVSLSADRTSPTVTVSWMRGVPKSPKVAAGKSVS